MAISKTGGSRFFVSPTTVDPDTVISMTEAELLAFYEAISNWIEVEEVENLGDIGDTAEVVSFTSIGRNRVRKLKGPRNAGSQSVVVGRDPLDDGQEALIAAEKTDFNYPFKIELNDARAQEYTKSVLYYAGLVAGAPTSMGTNAQVTTRSFAVEVNTAVLEVASENTGP